MCESTASAGVRTDRGASAAQGEFVRFVLVGGFAALVNLASRWLLNLFMGYSPAILVAYLCGMATAFVLSKLFVFPKSRLGTHVELLRFSLVNLAAVIQVWVVSMLLGEWLLPLLGIVKYAHDIGHIVGVAVPVFTSYLGHKHFSFQRY